LSNDKPMDVPDAVPLIASNRAFRGIPCRWKEEYLLSNDNPIDVPPAHGPMDVPYPPTSKMIQVFLAAIKYLVRTETLNSLHFLER